MKSFKWVIFVLGVLYSPSNAEAIATSPSPLAIDSAGVSANQTMMTEDWQQILEEMAENGMKGAEWEERLAELANNPISLNEASKEELENIPFINDDVIENLSYYLYRYGPMVNLSELMLVEGMDAQTIRWLKPFVRIEKGISSPIVVPSMQKALVYGKQSLCLNMGRMIQQKIGFDRNQADSNRYAGDPTHVSLRYGFDYKGQLQWGVVLEKDPGEKWWNPGQHGIDYSSFHFVAKDAKRKNLCLFGDYNVRFGQGLVCGSSFSMGKNTSGLSPEMTGSSIRRHFSSSEVGFFRGVALQLTLKPFQLEENQLGLDLSAFLSKRRLDANVENGVFTTVYETGLHRNGKELETQNLLGQTVFGGHLGIRKLHVAFGLTLVTWFHDGIGGYPGQVWNVFKSNWDHGGNLSADFRVVVNRFLIFGEMALDQHGHDALLAGFTLKPYPRMALSMLARKYSPNYQALFGNAFSEGTSVNNEEGLYASTEVQLAKRLRFTGYLDVFRFPWLNFGVNAPSWGRDLALELSSTFGRNGLVKWMIKSKMKEKSPSDETIPISPLSSGVKTQMRLQIIQRQGFFSMKTQLHYTTYRADRHADAGFALAQDLGIESITMGLSVVLHAVLFHTETWENRIYLWEKDLPGSFSMPMLYGKGSRLSLCAKYEFKKLEIQIKVSNHVMPNLKDLGVEQERIHGNRRTEAGCQLNWKF